MTKRPSLNPIQMRESAEVAQFKNQLKKILLNPNDKKKTKEAGTGAQAAKTSANFHSGG